MPEANLGTYTYARETKNTRRYEKPREGGNGVETIYIPKSALGGNAPTTVEIIAKFK